MHTLMVLCFTFPSLLSDKLWLFCGRNLHSLRYLMSAASSAGKLHSSKGRAQRNTASRWT